MNIESGGDAGLDGAQELEKLAAAMAPMQFADHLTAGDVQCCEQRRRSMAHVVVGTPRRNTGCQRQNRLGSVQRLNLALLIDAQHQRLGRRGKVQPDDVAHLVDKQWVGRELECFLAMGLQAKSAPDATDGGLRQPCFTRHVSRAPVRRIFRYRFERLRNDGINTRIVYGAWRSWPGRVKQAIEPIHREAVTPFRDGLLCHRDLLGDSLAINARGAF
ncbi:MAG: hypothetical protein BWZ07_03346 [Alphaproteobacteria bacterium ADurb.BinA280]|nr:MAG: hypothetical protein BWZ07_03346 [Alphaproteobacteria bacterium ADurb.BinA280]